MSKIEPIGQVFRELKNDYSAARASRFRRVRSGVPVNGSGADYHYRNDSDYLKIMEYARDMDRNDVIIGQTVDRAVVNTVQGGIGLDIETGDTAINEILTSMWNDWKASPDRVDVAGVFNFSQLEHLMLRARFIDGDIFVLPTNEGSLQIFESHRVRTPNFTKKTVVHGVEMDSRRRRKAYYITRESLDPHSVIKLGDVEVIPARDEDGYQNVFHLFDPKRISQTRGVSVLAPIFDQAGMFEDINFAKLVQQQVVSCITIFREMESGFGPDYPGNKTSTGTKEAWGTGERIIEGIAPGLEIRGRAGEKLHGFSPNVPNAEFFPHVRMMLQIIGCNLGMPLVMVLLDASETNFSGYRGAVEQARMGFHRNQRMMVDQFNRPVYLWKVREFLRTDAALRRASTKAGINIFGHRWNPPVWPYIEPSKDAAADEKRLSANLISPRRLHAERGRDFDEIAREIVEDRQQFIAQAIEAAKALNEANPEAKVDWREIAGYAPLKISAQAAREDSEQAEGNKPKEDENE